MSKQIRPTQEAVDKLVAEFADIISTGKFSNGEINFKATLGKVDRKADLYFTEIAWLKMQTLIREWDKEIAWHGLAYRGEDETKDEYIIKDIMVYPQEVTGATVTTDQEKYQTWLYQHDDDVFNNIRMQGHSHVNMDVTPSSVDKAWYEQILEQMTDDMFYIFMIWNKSGKKTIKIYDMRKNILFDTADVDILILDDGTGVESFLAEAKEMVKDEVKKFQAIQTPQYASSGNSKKKYTKKEIKNSYGTSGYGYSGYGYQGYYNDYYDDDLAYENYGNYRW